MAFISLWLDIWANPLERQLGRRQQVSAVNAARVDMTPLLASVSVFAAHVPS